MWKKNVYFWNWTLAFLLWTKKNGGKYLLTFFVLSFDLNWKLYENILKLFQSVLESLPGVDPQSDAVRQAVGAMSRSGTDNTKKEDSEKKDDKSKK